MVGTSCVTHVCHTIRRLAIMVELVPGGIGSSIDDTGRSNSDVLRDGKGWDPIGHMNCSVGDSKSDDDSQRSLLDVQ